MKPAEHTSARPAGVDGQPASVDEPASIEDQCHGVSDAIPAGHLFVVASRYHIQACDSMVAAAVETIRQAGVDHESIRIVRVPGAWELPLAVQTVLQQPRAAGVIAIGVVIRGETTHDEHINRAVTLELMRLGTTFGKPVGLGLLTCNNEDQVIARTGGKLGNKGIEAAEAVLEMLRLTHHIRYGGI